MIVKRGAMFNFKQIGLTLIEVLISITILAAGVVVLVKFQGDLLRNLGVAHQHSTAIALAESRLNQLRNQTYANIVAGNASDTLNNVSYSTTWAVVTNTDPDYKTITVTVSWTDQRGTNQSVQLQTIVSNVDPANSGKVMQSL